MTRVLLDIRGVEGTLSVAQRYEWATFVAAAHQAYVAAGHQPVRFTILGEPPLVDPQRLGEVVAANRGLDVRVTDDAAEAATWLGIDPREIG